MRVPLKATIVNGKGRVFTVEGFMWDDGVFFLRNPRPARYLDYKGLLGGRADKALRWTTDPAGHTDGDLSPFTVRSLLLAPAKKTKASRTKKTA